MTSSRSPGVAIPPPPRRPGRALQRGGVAEHLRVRCSGQSMTGCGEPLAGASGFCARWRSRWSASTQASIASPTGTARMPTQGSWRPLVRSRSPAPTRSTVWRGVRIELVGFTAKRATIGWPVEMPPRMPPAWLEPNTTRPSVAHAHLVGILLAGQGRGGEALADLDALDRVDRHQRRGDIGVELAVDRRAEAGRARPRPPPRSPRRAEEPDLRTSVRCCFPARRPRRGRGRRTGCRSTAAQSQRGAVDAVRRRSAPARRGCVTLGAPSTLRATPPAATRIAVSRAEERPPPR